MPREQTPRFHSDRIAFSDYFAVWQSGTTSIVFRSTDREECQKLAAALTDAAAATLQPHAADHFEIVGEKTINSWGDKKLSVHLRTPTAHRLAADYCRDKHSRILITPRALSALADKLEEASR